MSANSRETSPASTQNNMDPRPIDPTYQMARTFHQTFDPRIPQSPTPFSGQEALFRAGFKLEELVEFVYAASGDEAEFTSLVAGLELALQKAVTKVKGKKQVPAINPLVEQADALVDLIYFAYGSFALMGVDPTQLLEIVHQANLHKLFPDGTPHYDEVTHKVLKPANWEKEYAPEAKIKAEIARQIKEAK